MMRPETIRRRRIGVAVAAWIAAAMTVAASVFLVDDMMVDDLSDAPSADAGRWQPARLDMRADLGRLSGMIAANMPEVPRTSAEVFRSKSHLAAADNYIQAGEHAKALLELKDGLSLNPHGTELLSRAGVIAATLRRFSEAEGYMRRYLQQQPDDVVHLSGLAAILIRLARLDDAGVIVDRLDSLRTDYLPARFNRLCIQVIREEREIVRDWWQRRTIEELGLTSAWLASDRAELSQVMGREDFARICDVAMGPGTSERVTEIASAAADACQRQSQGKAGDLIAALDRLQALGVHPAIVERARADLLAAAGDATGAVAIWQRLLEQSPAWPEGWMLYGRLQLKSGAYAEAVDALQKALDESPADDRFRFLLASAHAMNGEIKTAQNIYEDLARRRGRDMRAWLDSDAVFDQALKKVPNFTAILRRLDIPPESE